MEAMKKIIIECAETEKATQADLEELGAHKPATSKTAKCHRACMHEHFGTVGSFIDSYFLIYEKKSITLLNLCVKNGG